MAFSVNRVTLVGNLTKDPELKYTPGGIANLTLGVATNRSIKEGEGWKDVPTFHRVIVWAKKAEFAAKALSKGDRVYLDGRVDNRSYEDKNGKTVYISEVVAFNIIPLVKKEQTTASAKPAEDKVDANKPTTVDDFPDKPKEENNEDVNPEDIPF